MLDVVRKLVRNAKPAFEPQPLSRSLRSLLFTIVSYELLQLGHHAQFEIDFEPIDAIDSRDCPRTQLLEAKSIVCISSWLDEFCARYLIGIERETTLLSSRDLTLIDAVFGETRKEKRRQSFDAEVFTRISLHHFTRHLMQMD